MFQARFSLALVVALAASTALAGPLGTDPDGLEGFTGSVSFNADDILLVDLDYAVFAPGDYPDDGVNGDDPSDGSEYVYAYQAFNVSPSTVLTTVSIGLLDDNGASNDSSDPLHELLGGIEPTLMELNQVTGSFLVDFLTPPLPEQGGYSSVFLFTSPNPPTFVPASVMTGGLSDTRTAPSALPEPSCLALLGMGGLLIGRRRR